MKSNRNPFTYYGQQGWTPIHIGMATYMAASSAPE
jgi:hypothetical protein